MNDLARAVLVLASVVSLASALLTVRRRQARWPLTSIQQFGLAVVAAIVAVSSAAHSSGLDLTAVVVALALLAFMVYAWRVRTGRPTPTR